MEAVCVFCGKEANTREHVIPRCFLDKPYPSNLPSICSCSECNNSFSEDEQYLMYLIDFLKSIEENEGEFIRSKVQRTYRHSPSLEERMFDSIKLDEQKNAYFAIETERVNRVLKKIVYCLMVYNSRCQIDIERIAVKWRFLSQFAEDEIKTIRNEFDVEYQKGRFAYKIYNEQELALMFSDFLVAYACVVSEDDTK